MTIVIFSGFVILSGKRGGKWEFILISFSVSGRNVAVIQ